MKYFAPLRMMILAAAATGMVVAAASASAACSNPSGEVAKLIYDPYLNAIQYCDGTNWVTLGLHPLAPDVLIGDDHGYIVLSSGTYQGNLGGFSGADQSCLTDLTANDWQGKADAQARGLLAEGHIRAFLCMQLTCQGPLPLTEYVFANAGDVTAGGASFQTDGQAHGPHDQVAWDGPSYFNGTYNYWGGYGSVSASEWKIEGYSTGGNNLFCGNWTSNSVSGIGGRAGLSTATNGGRWDNASSCAAFRNLLCFVNP